MTELSELDAPYRRSIASTVESLEQVAISIRQDYSFDLRSTEISEAVLQRLKCYYKTQQSIKQTLNKRYQAAGADFFVETVLFFLQLFLDSECENLEVHSERQIKRKRGSIRPDISIWKNDQVVAIIECKTQLGWNRKNWENHFEEREKKLVADYPDARAFLLVMTSTNWGGFGDHSLVGSKYFCLLEHIWPSHYTCPAQILVPIEKLFRQVYECRISDGGNDDCSPRT